MSEIIDALDRSAMDTLLVALNLILELLLCLSQCKKRAETKRKRLSEKPFWVKRKVFGAKKKNKWEGQLLDPSVCYK